MARTLWRDAEVRHIGEGVLARTLPQPEWTHTAHFAATVFLLLERPEIDADLLMPGIIWRYNIASGTPNTDSRGYHETITRFYLMAVRTFLARDGAGGGLGATVSRLCASAFGQIGFPLHYYTAERLLSVEARRVWVEPDRQAFDFETCALEPDPVGEQRWKLKPPASPHTA